MGEEKWRSLQVRTAAAGHPGRRAFSLVELMMSISILIVVILAINMTFRGVSEQVGVSQATLEMMANVRAIQHMIQRDLRQLNRSGFLVIRTRLLKHEPHVPTAEKYTSYRFDQLSFLATGDFLHQGGSDTAHPFVDENTSTAAHIWIGQLVLERGEGDHLYMPADQSKKTPMDRLPTGAWDDENKVRRIQESAFALGRVVTTLFPGPADERNHVGLLNQPIVAYPDLEGISDRVIAGSVEGLPAHITSARFPAVAQTTAQIMNSIVNLRGTYGNANNPGFNPEAQIFTYRFRALDSVYATEAAGHQNPFVNGYYRTTPIVMRGVSSFRIDWTDRPFTRRGPVDWHGPGGRTRVSPELRDTTAPTEYGPSTLTGDDYTATFSYFNRARWPTALRFSMHVASERLRGGRNFTFIVELPQ